MLALIAFLAFVQKENTITGFSFLYGMAWPQSTCNVMSDIHIHIHRFLKQTGLKEKCFIYRGGSSSLLLSNSPISRFS